ncbi:MAG: Ribonuclease HII [Candidatus Hinthialibacteria bacterium OLB16]|nr:MAG: Ribonuclease HII [Candidatus Hinthialibacteria bacterium OLB16]
MTPKASPPLRSALERVAGMVSFDRSHCPDGVLAGIDEAGRGPWAGPVVAAGVVLDVSVDPALLYELNDSKKLTPRQRERLARKIAEIAQGIGVGTASVDEIDRLGILKATFLAMRRALDDLAILPDHILVDGNRDPDLGFPTTCLVQGDSRSASVAAASIMAKTHRDRLMDLLAGDEDPYGFRCHKGYGTELHSHALSVFGLSGHHRRSFKPVAHYLIHPGPSPGFLKAWKLLLSVRPGSDCSHLFDQVESELPYLTESESWLLQHRLMSLRSMIPKVPEGSLAQRHKGDFFEGLVGKYLKDKGFILLEQNYQTREGEIDWIVQDGETLVFIEVKMRRSAEYGGAAEAVDRRKRQRIILAALSYLDRYPREMDCRFDVVALEGDRKGGTRLEYFPNAFTLDP